MSNYRATPKYKERRRQQQIEDFRRECEQHRMIGHHVPVNTGEYREWRSR